MGAVEKSWSYFGCEEYCLYINLTACTGQYLLFYFSGQLHLTLRQNKMLSYVKFLPSVMHNAAGSPYAWSDSSE